MSGGSSSAVLVMSVSKLLSTPRPPQQWSENFHCQQSETARRGGSGAWQRSLLWDTQRRGPPSLSGASELLGQPLTPGQPRLDRLQCAQRVDNTSLNILSERESCLTTSLPQE